MVIGRVVVVVGGKEEGAGVALEASEWDATCDFKA